MENAKFKFWKNELQKVREEGYRREQENLSSFTKKYMALPIPKSIPICARLQSPQNLT